MASLRVIVIFGICMAFLTEHSNAGIFGFIEKKSSNITAISKWTGVLSRMKADESSCGNRPGCSLASVTNSISGNSDKMAMLKAVNSYINQVKYASDEEAWGKSDYWATPAEFFARGGDCEDYAIAKFSALRQLGFQDKDLRVLVLKNGLSGKIHSTLVAYINNKPYLLDNEIPVVIPANDIRHYIPVYSVNETGLWVYGM